MILRASTTTYLFFFFLLAHIPFLSAQDYPRSNFNWEPTRKITYKPTADELELPALVVLDNYFVDFTLGYTSSQKGELYVTEHKIVRVNNDIGIDMFNKVYLQLFEHDKLIKIGARTIMPNGVSHVLDKAQFKDVTNYEKYGNFKVFALEGVEKGCEVEYFYTIQRENYTDGHLLLQNHTKIKEQSVTLTYPDALQIDTRSYNGFPSLKELPSRSLKTWYAKATDIPVWEENEQYSAKYANRSKLSYKVTHNNNWPDQENHNWSHTLDMLYKTIYDEWDLPKLSLLPIADELKQLDNEARIKRLEAYLKEKFHFKTDPTWGKELSSANYVVKHNVGSELGLAKLYVGFLKDLKIPFDVIVTSSRADAKFDPKFPDYHNFREILIYFPQYQKFVSPSFQEYRYGPPPVQLLANYAISITSIDSGNIRIMPISEAKANKKLNTVDVTLDMDSGLAKITSKVRLLGFEALLMRGMYQALPPLDRDNALKVLTTNGLRVSSVQNIIAEGMAIDDSTYYRPLTVSADIQSGEVIERAGKTIVVNVGKLIGPQDELYNDTVRVNDIELQYPNTYQSMMHIEIPMGYKVAGLDELKTEKIFSLNGQTMCLFSSTYVINGHDLRITAIKQFNKVYYSKEHYKEFREVVDAAADFGKLQLEFEKE